MTEMQPSCLLYNQGAEKTRRLVARGASGERDERKASIVEQVVGNVAGSADDLAQCSVRDILEQAVQPCHLQIEGLRA
jgi:hypothetical protein